MFREKMRELAACFDLAGDFVIAQPYGSGHINDTYAVEMNQGGTFVRYIFQRINHQVFRQPLQMMDNIRRVTTHLHRKFRDRRDSSRHTLTVIPTRTSRPNWSAS